MATFLVRVALHGVPDTDDAYGELDTVLLHYDFTRSILGAEGNEYALPPGTYDGDSTMDADELRAELADAIEDSLETRFSILVVERITASWTGLPAFETPDED
jgi:hypothetical protein